MNKTSNNMNNVTNSIPLRRIFVPELNSAEFATGLQNAFININKNFALLANHDFVKGETGQSVNIQDDKFFNDNGELTIIGLKLKACIEANASSNELINVNYIDENNISHTISVWDNFTPDNAGTIQMIYNKINDNETTEPLSSLYYVFLDARYANDKIGSITRDDKYALQYANLKDMSCILVYDKNVSVTITQDGNDYTVNGGFKMLTNAFPSVYYEPNIGLCWKINGSNTGIPVQGLPGRDGYNAITRIVKCSNVSKTEYGVVYGKVSQIHDNFNGYEPISGDILKYNNSAALVLVTEDSNNGVSTDFNSGFYFGQLKVEDNELYAYCDQQNSINHGLSTQSIIEAMKHIDINNNGVDGSQGIKGLYIPINKVDDNGVQPIHLISSTSFSDDAGRGQGAASDKTDIIFTAINDINSFTDDDDLMVNKYLYVRINPEHNIFYSNCDYTNRLANTDKYKGIILKYKLTDHVVDATSPFINDIVGESKTIASRYYGAITNQDKTVSVQLNDDASDKLKDNVKYYVYNSGITDGKPNGKLLYSNNHLDSMPDVFRNKLNSNGTQKNPGLYRWELCNKVDVFDIDELTKSNDATIYDFPNELGVIFTDTITPGEDTNFLWFNGIQLADYSYFGFNERKDTDANDNGIISIEDGTESGQTYYVVPGWYMSKDEIDGLDRSVLLSFVKFIPVYENSMEYVGDTALNLNYNVNVGGNSNNHEKSLTVNGKINCNDLNVCNLTASGEIKNIYTRDTIIGDSGIKLAVKTDSKEGEDKYNLQIDDSGNITTTGDIYNESMHTDKETNNVIVKSSVVAKKAKLTSLELNSEYDSETPVVFAGNVGTPGAADKFKFGVELSNIHNIKLARKDIADKNPVELPKLISDVTSINYNKSNLIVTNSEPNDSNLQYIGNTDGLTEPTSCSFDEIFNSNITSASKDAINSFKRYADISKSTPYTIKESTVIYDDLIDILRSCPGVDNLLTTQPNRYAAESSNTFSNCANSTLTINTKEHTDAHIKNNTICKFILKNDKDNISLSTSDNINIKFDSKYLVRLCCNGKCKNGKRPVLKDYSNITLHVYYVKDGKYKEIEELKTSYAFPEMRWFGETRDGESYGDEYGWRFRYYDFIFKPKNLTISSGSTAFSDIYNKFEENKGEVEIRIVASYNITFKGESGKDVIGGAFVHKPIPINAEPGENNTQSDNKQYTNITDGKLTTSVYAANNFSQHVDDWDKIFNIGEGKIGNIQYFKVESSESAVFNSTTLCNDGVVVRSNDKTSIQIFGIGMKNMTIGDKNDDKPHAILRFYHKPSDPTKTTTDKVIDLESLFNLPGIVTDITNQTNTGTNTGGLEGGKDEGGSDIETPDDDILVKP